jgi:Tol biopolymer transport system component
MRAVAASAVGLLLIACQGEDAYLGSSQVRYQCGTRCQLEQGVPADAGDWFFNPEAQLGDAPQIVYPLSGSVHPQDLGQLTVQFRRGRPDFSVFRVRIEASGVAYDFFTPCLVVAGDGCRYLLSGMVWDAARADLVGKPALITVTGSTARSGVMRSSAALPVSVTESALRDKGFYYWTSVPLYSGVPGDQATGIFRLPFGADHAEPFIMPNSATNGRQCGACHSVSQDGSTIAFTARNENDELDQRSGVLVTARTTRPDDPFIVRDDDTYDSSMMALSSDGRRVLVAFDHQLVLRDASADAPGEVITTITAEMLGAKDPYFPEFSPNDDAVVLTLSDQPDSAIAVQSGDIAVIGVDLATSTFTMPSIVVPGTEQEFHFYPTWSPDGEFIAFASAPRAQGSDPYPPKSYDQKRARLRLVRRAGGEVIELTRATHELEKWSTFPKFAPFLKDEQGGLMFLTFNSKINYGLLLDNDAQTSDAARVPQLWMSAIDVSKWPEDPSSAPIWLPFQDATQSSHLGIWTRDVKCRTDVGMAPACDVNQQCDEQTNTCKVIVK